MNMEYQAFVKEAGHPAPPGWEGEDYPEDRGDHSVVNVSWYDAIAYCRWLTKKLRAAGWLRSDEVVRLPTEAEWEKAAGWDAEKKVKRIYPWGNEFDPAKCNTSEGGKGGTTPVGQTSPAGDSPYGASDMAGNVWEWCQDWYAGDYYQRSPSENPSGPEEGESRVLRGGSWGGRQGLARCAYRLRDVPDDRDHLVGFRVAASPSSP